MRVGFDGNSVFRASAQHLLDIDLIAGPPQHLLSGHVAQDRLMPVQTARSRRSVCAFRSILDRPWMLATKSNRSSTSSE
jgi:hypothetical protein